MKMKITVTREFDTVEEALAFLNPTVVTLGPAPITRLLADDANAVPITRLLADDAVPLSPQPSLPQTEPSAEPGKRARKPRSDAGKPRGSYNKQTTGEPAASEPGVHGSDPAPTPQPAVQPRQLTLDDLRAAMRDLASIEGKGMDANIASLGAFGVLRVSDLAPEKYAKFHQYILDQLPKSQRA